MARKTKQVRRTAWHEVAGLLLVGFCLLLFLSQISYRPGDIGMLQDPPHQPPRNFIGPLGAWLGFGTVLLFGVAAYAAPWFTGAYGLLLIFKREGRLWPKAAWMFVVLLAIVCLVELQPEVWATARAALEAPSTGGLAGLLLAQGLLIRLLGGMGAGIVAASLVMAGLVFLFEVHPVTLGRRVVALAILLGGKWQAFIQARRDRRAEIAEEEKKLVKQQKRLERAMARQPAPRRAAPAPPGNERSPPAESAPPPRPAKRPPKQEPSEEAEILGAVVPPATGDYVLPGLDLLEAVPVASGLPVKEDYQTAARILQETLADFGIEAEVTNIERGPVVTRYEMLPAPGIRVERIAGLSNNIALAMKAESVRVQAPVPGKGVVGIEVPNSKTTVVSLREVMESDEWRSSEAALPLCLGKDVGGRVLVADLAAMPHLLIAGATGSGKTVCMNSLLAGLLMSRTPDQLRLMLIDPKIVEFGIYNSLPHLVVPVITDPKKVFLGLKWAINEMEKRYKLFAKAGVRNITGFNSRPIAKQAELFEEDMGLSEEKKPALPERLPYIVVVVDELADLMMVAQADVENAIGRLAQLSRAVGVHLIIATQRPSVNVITGTIKANIPARLAFQVAQRVDSRTILDANGADKLLGRGDMLFLPPGTSKLVRAQATLSEDSEIRRIVEFIGTQGEPQYETEVQEKIESKAPALPEMDQDDELMEAAVEIIRQTKRASTSSLQRRLRIGYTRAARLMDLLEERGVVGPPRGSDPREILIDLDGEIPQNAAEPTEP